MTRFARRFRKVGRTLSRVELMRSSFDDASFALTDQDLLDKEAGRRFLDFYGDEGLRLAFERYGFFDAMRARGWDDFAIHTSSHDEQHTLFVEACGHEGGDPERLIELVVRRDRLRIDAVPGYDPIETAFEVMTIDWLTLRDPMGSFTAERLRLPGQDAPGLGIGERMLELMYRAIDRLALDGLITVAEYFHNAVLYARELPFVDPHYRGQLRALEALLFEREKLSFPQAAWALHWGHVLDVDDRVVRWTGQAMCGPRNDELARYFGSRAYGDAVQKACERFRYRLHRDAFDEHWERAWERLLEPPAQDEDAA